MKIRGQVKVVDESAENAMRLPHVLPRSQLEHTSVTANHPFRFLRCRKTTAICRQLSSHVLQLRTYLAPVGAGIHERLDELVDLGGDLALDSRLHWLRSAAWHFRSGRCGHRDSDMRIQGVEGGRFEGVEGALEEDRGEEGTQYRWGGGALDALGSARHSVAQKQRCPAVLAIRDAGRKTSRAGPEACYHRLVGDGV